MYELVRKAVDGVSISGTPIAEYMLDNYNVLWIVSEDVISTYGVRTNSESDSSEVNSNVIRRTIAMVGTGNVGQGFRTATKHGNGTILFDIFLLNTIIEEVSAFEVTDLLSNAYANRKLSESIATYTGDFSSLGPVPDNTNYSQFTFNVPFVWSDSSGS